MLSNHAQRLAGRVPLRPSGGTRAKHSASGLTLHRAHPAGPQVLPPPPPGSSGTGAPARRKAGFLHLHRYTWYAEDPFSGHSLYACRCGRVRPGL